MLAATRVLARLTAVVAVLVVVPVSGAAARGAVPRIAENVTAHGVHIGGLTEADATAKIDATLGKRMRAPVVVKVGNQYFKLRPATGQFTLDARRMARGALKVPPVSAAGGVVSGSRRDIRPAIKHSRAAVQRFVGQIAAKRYVATRNARLKMGMSKMRLTRQRPGRTINQSKTAYIVNRALDDIDRGRELKIRNRWIAPRRTTADLARAHPRIITIDRGTFTLRLFWHLKLSKRYGVAVGMAGLATPAGHYTIQDKQVDPAWHVPNSAWAGSLAGHTIPGGAPDNPLKARWMGLAGGVGIHGTAEDWSIGGAASHGCIRMHVSDVKDLYQRVTVGTPVIIK